MDLNTGIVVLFSSCLFCQKRKKILNTELVQGKVTLGWKII